jgi:hypothetical protein
VALINFNDCAGSSDALGMLSHVYEHSLRAEHSPITDGLTAEAVLQSYYRSRYSAHDVREQQNFREREREVAAMEPRAMSYARHMRATRCSWTLTTSPNVSVRSVETREPGHTRAIFAAHHLGAYGPDIFEEL